MNNFGNFLTDVHKSPDEVEKLYRHALELAPDNAGIMCNLATLLKSNPKNYNEAEEFYRLRSSWRPMTPTSRPTLRPLVSRVA